MDLAGWDAVYSVVFAGMSVLFVRDDFMRDRHWFYLALAVATYTLMNFGNCVFAFGLSHERMRLPWRILAPYFIFYFIFSGAEDRRLRKPEEPDFPGLEIFVWIAGAAFMTPMFLNNLSIAGLWPCRGG